MLHRLDGDHEWPLGLVRQVWLFGSFARGASEPYDIDVAIRSERDERTTEAVVQSPLSGGRQSLRTASPGARRHLTRVAVPV
jgi:hypothetical protein